MEEEDTHLFNSLGVTSANPDDIERDILAEVRNDSGNNNEAGVNKEVLDKSKCHEQPSPSRRKELYKKLRAVKFEIDAVASTIEHARDDKKIEDCVPESDDDRGCLADVKVTRQGSVIDTTLQQALATERLRSLEKTEAQLKNELRHCTNGYSQGVEDYEILRSLVNEEPRKKRKLKEVQKLIKGQGKKQKEVSYDDDAEFDSMLDAASTGFVETERDTLVRKGFLTPFHKLKGFERRLQQPGPYNKKNELEGEDKNEDPASASVDRALQSISEAAQARPTTKLLDSNDLPKLDPPTRPFHRLKKPIKVSHGDSKADTRKDVTTLNSFLTEKRKDGTGKIKRPLPGKKWRKIISREENIANGNEEAVESLVTSSYEDENQNVLSEDNIELPFVTLEGGLRIPENIFSELFDYQKVGVQWLWELHCQRAGGIIGDEMGLGKTVQVLSFLGALHFSKMYKPSIIICPVTLLRQWKREAKKWYPDFHVEILHDSAQDLTNKKKQSKDDGSDYESGSSIDTDSDGNLSCRNTNKWDSLINRVLRSESGLLVTTYEQLRLLGEQLLDVEWGYAVLDEGHRIRNPNAETTLVCKQLQTVHRIIMTGAPIQNKLAELWSLFDFVFPGKLGVLPVFEAEFAVPISVGGYANATPLQVSTAYRCAVVLRDLIMPYLLRRMKADVRAHLPKKIEHVLFCSLTAEQRSTYRAFLASSEVEQIFDGSRNSLSGIDVMRKICNHPDLLERDHAHGNPDYGNPERSGKMKVVAQVLKVWKEQGHRVLLFSQTQQMLDILESFLISGRYNYRRLDGLTPIRQRMALIDEFNNSDDVFIFILTTKVGGLGTNLTGADRVIIFDPDWNPSTDMQARERAWRIGQKRDVTVYRLITRGTIEEKVYHRQIYKHFLTNKILNNPRQKRFFKARDMKDLFSLTDDGDGLTETSNIFSQITGDVHVGATRGSLAQINQNFEATAAPYAEGPTVEKGNNLERESSENIGKGKNDQNDGEVDEETSILKSLFDAHGLHSALNHDAIMNAHDGEKTRLEEQASQVAARAAEALRQSRMLRGRASVSVPTWTGKSGSAGAPSLASQKFGSTVGSQFATSSVHFEEPSRRLPNGFPAGTSAGKALSSADLLARIRGNQEQAVSDGLLQHELGMSFASRNGERSPNPRSAPHSLSGVQPEVLIRQICTFIQQRGGVASSAGIVAHFKDRIPSKDLPLFKRLLKEIATLEKGTSGSSWVLKPEYRQQ